MNFELEGEEEAYFDDPDFATVDSRKKKLISVLALVSLFFGGSFFLQTTFAGNLNINSNKNIEFGQGTSILTACSGSAPLTLKSISSFSNTSGAGTHYLSGVTVSGIPNNCYGFDFSVSAYGASSSTPLAIFSSSSTIATVYDNAGTFSTGSGLSVTGSGGSFTLTFSLPVAEAKNVYKVTLQTSPHTPMGCAAGGTCSIGDVSPAGGTVFYYAPTGFNCGSSFTSTGSPTGGLCHYLEFAPYGWNTGNDPRLFWSPVSFQGTDIAGINNDSYFDNTSSAIGLGYKNSVLIVNTVGAGTNYAAALARSYAPNISGTTYSDWYLPTLAELNQLCKYARGQAWVSDSTLCASSGTLKTAQADGGFLPVFAYATSSEYSNQDGINQFLDDGFQGHSAKSYNAYVRPIRAF